MGNPAEGQCDIIRNRGTAETRMRIRHPSPVAVSQKSSKSASLCFNARPTGTRLCSALSRPTAGPPSIDQLTRAALSFPSPRRGPERARDLFVKRGTPTGRSDVPRAGVRRAYPAIRSTHSSRDTGTYSSPAARTRATAATLTALNRFTEFRWFDESIRFETMFECVSITPLGSPVVPDV